MGLHIIWRSWSAVFNCISAARVLSFPQCHFCSRSGFGVIADLCVKSLYSITTVSSNPQCAPLRLQSLLASSPRRLWLGTPMVRVSVNTFFMWNLTTIRPFLPLTWAATAVHQQIAYAAEEFLTPLTRTILKQLLEPQYKGSLGLVGAWADSYRKTTEGAYTDTWHYIDPADDPPSYCNGELNKVVIFFSGGSILVVELQYFSLLHDEGGQQRLDAHGIICING